MIGIDTSIAVRLLTRDHEEQYALAHDLFANCPVEGHLCLNLITLTEIVWVLESRLKLPVTKARKLARGLVGAEQTKVVQDAVVPDLFAVLDSQHMGWTDAIVSAINLSSGCEFTYTFDKRAARDVPGMKLLA